MSTTNTADYFTNVCSDSEEGSYVKHIVPVSQPSAVGRAQFLAQSAAQKADTLYDKHRGVHAPETPIQLHAPPSARMAAHLDSVRVCTCHPPTIISRPFPRQDKTCWERLQKTLPSPRHPQRTPTKMCTSVPVLVSQIFTRSSCDPRQRVQDF